MNTRGTGVFLVFFLVSLSSDAAALEVFFVPSSAVVLIRAFGAVEAGALLAVEAGFGAIAEVGREGR